MRRRIRTVDDLQQCLFEMLCAAQRATPDDLPWYLAYGTALGAAREGNMIAWDSDIDVHVPLFELDRYLTSLADELDPRRFRVQLPGAPGSDVVIPRIVHVGLPQDYVHIDIFPLVPTSMSRRRQSTFDRQLRVLAKLHLLRTYDHSAKAYLPWRTRWIAAGARAILSLAPRTVFLRLFRAKVTSAAHNEEHPIRYYSLGGSYGLCEFFDANWFAEPEQVSLRGVSFPAPTQIDAYLTSLYGDYRSPPSAMSIAESISFNNNVVIPALIRAQE